MSSGHSRNLSVSLYVRGLAKECRSVDLKEIFGRYGRIMDIKVPLDYYTRNAKGYAFVEYEKSGDAEEAIDALHRYKLFGQELRIEFARGDRKTPSEMRARGKEGRYRRGGDVGHRNPSQSRSRPQQSASSVANDYRRGSGRGGASRPRSADSRSSVSRRPVSYWKYRSPNSGKPNGSGNGNAARRVTDSRLPDDN